MKQLFQEFKEFAMKGSVLDLAIGLIIGAAFGKIITSAVNDVLMPPVGMLLGQVDFSDLFINLSDAPAESLAAAKQAGLPVIAYGLFLNQVIDFLIVAFVIFLLVKQINRFKRGQEAPEAEPTMKECPFCYTSIPIKAARCPNCTSALEKPEAA